jgi:CRP/FNR family transcriptional regulator
MHQVTLLNTPHPANDGAREARLLEGMLSSLALFRGLAPNQLQRVAARSRLRSARRGERVCGRGDPMPGVFSVGYGMLKLALPHADGERVVRFLRPGECFGEASALLGRPCLIDAIALEESMLAVVPAQELARLLEVDQGFARNLAGALAARTLGLLVELEASAQQSGLQRLASYLNSLAQADGRPGRWLARLPATKTAVAARLGVKKETLSRMFRQLAGRGLIEVSGREVAILDRQALTRLADVPA